MLSLRTFICFSQKLGEYRQSTMRNIMVDRTSVDLDK